MYFLNSTFSSSKTINILYNNIDDLRQAIGRVLSHSCIMAEFIRFQEYFDHTFWTIIKGTYPIFNWTIIKETDPIFNWTWFMEKHNLLVMDDTLYLFVNKHIYTVDSYRCTVGFLNSSHRRNGVDTSITLDAAKWNCAGGELSSCVINTIPLDHVL